MRIARQDRQDAKSAKKKELLKDELDELVLVF